MSDRRIDAFFYGLFMDLGVLREGGVAPINPRRAYVNDFALRIGQRATLLPSAGARAYGMLFALTHAELDRLYAAPGLDAYSAGIGVHDAPEYAAGCVTARRTAPERHPTLHGGRCVSGNLDSSASSSAPACQEEPDRTMPNTWCDFAPEPPPVWWTP